jgi:hexosaminidase
MTLHTRSLLAGCLAGGLAACVGETPAPPRFALIPQPLKLATAPGTFTVSTQTVFVARGAATTEAVHLARALTLADAQGGKLLAKPPPDNFIALELDPDLASALGTEGYRLSVTPQHAILRAATEAGLFYAGVTFRQLLPLDARAGGRTTGNRWPLPCVEIEDTPRFAWRGLLLDVARHFFPPEFIERFIDLAALHKFNSLQLHLTDDQGWRVEIRKYPRLTAIGSVRPESPRPGDRNQGDGIPYGPYYYTQAQLRDLVAYARARHVTLVPEIEMPGHFLGALAAYPELSCTGGPFTVRTRWGVEADILCGGSDQAVAFAQDVLAEIMTIFPGPFIHIGGDEAPRDRWKACPRCQARIKAEGLKNEAELQSWFNHRIEEFLSRHGRRLIGWDEILEGGLTPGAAVMSWRGTAGGLAAAQAGHDVVMSPTSHCYFDYAEGKGLGEPESIGGYLPLRTVYEFEPVPPTLANPQRGHILGAQGNLWTEYIGTSETAEYFAFPRAVALAEVVWSPAVGRDYPDFLARLRLHARRLDALGVHYRGWEQANSPAR